MEKDRSEYHKEWYNKNRERILEQQRNNWKEHYEKSKGRKRAVILEHQEHISNYKKDKGCSICGYKEYPEILQFHHNDRKQKSFTIGKRFGKNIEVIKREMEKCILLCPNCHAWLHFKEEQEKVTP